MTIVVSVVDLSGLDIDPAITEHERLKRIDVSIPFDLRFGDYVHIRRVIL